MKKIILLYFVTLFISCTTISYDGETKLVVKGVIVDENNLPIANNDIKLVVSVSGQESFIFPSGSESNYIGRTTSKSDGSYIMVIPKPSNFGQIAVETNSEGNIFNQKQFVNIQLDNFVNYEFTLPETILFKNENLSILKLTTNQVNTNYKLINIEYIGAVANEYQIINPYEEYIFFNESNVKLKKNQTIILKYTVKDYVTNAILIFEENVIIGNEPEINYTLNY